jgi:hypothetical protein
MSYRDLPADLSSRPLDDQSLAADVIDLIIEPDDRERGCVAAMLCDARGIGVHPVVIGDIEPGHAVSALHRLLGIVLPEVAANGGSVLLGLGRAGGIVLSDADRAWHQGAIDACRAHGVRLLAAFVATPAAVRPFPPDLRVAS